MDTNKRSKVTGCSQPIRVIKLGAGGVRDEGPVRLSRLHSSETFGGTTEVCNLGEREWASYILQNSGIIKSSSIAEIKN